MNNKLLGALSVACISLLFSACGSENSASAEDEYSSSVIANEVTQSSSSEARQSSSSIASSSSSPRKDNSSSSIIANSSSSETTQSSSSITTATPCNVDGENNCAYGTLTDIRDGKTYKTLTIGTQTWMAENLNYAYTGVPYEYINGSEVNTSDSTSWCYDDDPDNCTKYGRLYTWAAAMDSVGKWSTNGKGCGYANTCSPTYPVRGICPEGWHLPSKTEFEALITAVGGSSTAGAKLKSQTGWTAYGGITYEDSFGFSALPAGYRYGNGDYYDEGNDADFWDDSGNAFSMYLNNYGDGYAYLNLNDKLYGFSVRCVKD